MLVSGQNAVRAFTKSWPIIPTLKDPVRPLAQVEALGHWEKDLAIYLDAHPGLLDCGSSPLVNGGFEGAAGPPPANWGEFNATATRVAGRPGSAGAFAGRMSFSVAALGLMFNTCTTVGVTYLAEGWMNSDGLAVPMFSNGGGPVYWTGVASVVWQFFSVIFTATNLNVCAQCNNLAAGRYVQLDDLVLTPISITTWFDRTRRGGRNPTQATASKRPAQTTSAIGSNVTFSGSTVTVPVLRTGAFPYVQPTQDLLSARWTPNATSQTDILDGGAANTHVLWTAIADPTFRGYAGVVLNDGAAVDGTSRVYEAVFNGAASKMRSNDNAYSVGNAGVLNPNGLSIGANGAGLGEPASCTVKSLLSFSVPQSEGTSTRISAAMRRRISY